MSEDRHIPNILITGTPGTGKSTLAEELQTALLEKLGVNFTHLNVSELAKENDFLDEWDDGAQCHVLDEDALLDHMEALMQEGGKIVEYHACELFPERWFDSVWVLRTNNSILHARLTQRAYSDKKILENVECEIMQVLLDEARESYRPEIVFELVSETTGELEKNVQDIVNWCLTWSSSR